MSYFGIVPVSGILPFRDSDEALSAVLFHSSHVVCEGSLRYLVVSQSEVARLKRVFWEAEEEREKIRRIESEGVKLVDISRMAHISRRTLNSWYQRGKLKATMLREGIRRCLVVRKDEFERLIREYAKKSARRVDQ